jgi:hypothetical protein
MKYTIKIKYFKEKTIVLEELILNLYQNLVTSHNKYRNH